MAERLTRKARSALMARVKARGTAPENAVRQLLHDCEIDFVEHAEWLPGRPDFYLPEYETAVLVHGCFWHAHAGCARASLPLTNRAFWKSKLDRNKQRDLRVLRAIRKQGLHAIVFWACNLPDEQRLASRLSRMLTRSVTRMYSGS